MNCFEKGMKIRLVLDHPAQVPIISPVSGTIKQISNDFLTIRIDSAAEKYINHLFDSMSESWLLSSTYKFDEPALNDCFVGTMRKVFPNEILVVESQYDFTVLSENISVILGYFPSINNSPQKYVFVVTAPNGIYPILVDKLPKFLSNTQQQEEELAYLFTGPDNCLLCDEPIKQEYKNKECVSITLQDHTLDSYIVHQECHKILTHQLFAIFQEHPNIVIGETLSNYQANKDQ